MAGLVSSSGMSMCDNKIFICINLLATSVSHINNELHRPAAGCRLQAARHSASNQSLQCSTSSPVASELRLLRPSPQPSIYWMYHPEQNFQWWWVRIIWFQALQHNIKYKSDLWWGGRRGEPVEEIFPLSFYWRVYFVMPTIKGEESRAGNQIMRSLKFHNHIERPYYIGPYKESPIQRL